MRLRLRANGGRDNTNVTRRSHYHKSLLRDNDRAAFRAKLVIIYVDWIAQLRRLLIRDNDRAAFRAKLVIIYVDWIAQLRRLLMKDYLDFAIIYHFSI